MDRRNLFAAAVGIGLLSGAAPLSANALSATTAAPSVFGQWKTDDGSGIVKVARCGEAVCGTLVKVLDPAAPDKDINNPDPDLRGQPLVGTKVITGMQRKNGRWEDGRAYDPKAGRSYRARMELASANRLDVTGCVLVICKTKSWTRVSN